jgi:hypothetical protein
MDLAGVLPGRSFDIDSNVKNQVHIIFNLKKLSNWILNPIHTSKYSGG